MSTYRFEHKTLSEGRFHVITSPDIKGFHVTGLSLEEATKEALVLLQLLSDKQMLPELGSLKSIEFEAAVAA